MSHQKLQRDNLNNSNNPNNDSSIRSHYMVGDEEPLEPGESSDNVIEIRY